MIIGIDPGLTGALSLIDGEDCYGVWDMPVSAKVHGKGNEVNAPLLADLLREIVEVALCHAPDDQYPTVAVEQVSAMPGQGVSSMFGFGRSAGVIDGVAAGLGLRVVRVTPQRWKRAYGLLKRDKDASRTVAIATFPKLAGDLKRKKDVGRSDSMLIAAYAGAHGV